MSMERVTLREVITFESGMRAGRMESLGKLVKRIEEQRSKYFNQMSKEENETLEMILHWIVEIENEKE